MGVPKHDTNYAHDVKAFARDKQYLYPHPSTSRVLNKSDLNNPLFFFLFLLIEIILDTYTPRISFHI
jgi:hypothetical protein